MADIPISLLPSATTPLTGEELTVVVQNNVTSKTPVGSASASTGVRQVASYAALTALTAAKGLVDGGLYYTKCRATARDGGQGVWQYDAASTTTANGGTILAIDGGGAGRFFRLLDDENTHEVSWFGVRGSATGAVNYAGVKACAGAIQTLGSGSMEFNGSHTYAIYPDNTYTDPMIEIANCYGVKVNTNGCRFTIARPFADGQFIFPLKFTNVAGLYIGSHTVTSAQQDAPASSLLRGNWWISLEGCTGVTGGDVTVIGGRTGVDLVRGDADLTNQCRSVTFQSIVTESVFYPFDCRNTGIDVTVGRVDCTNGGRPFIGYGFRGVRINELHTEDMVNAIVIVAHSTGSVLDLGDPKTIGFYTKLFVRNPTPGQGIGNLVNMSIRGTTPCTISDITVVYDNVEFTGANGSEQLFTWDKRSTDVTPDSVVRGHTVEDVALLGSCYGFNPAVIAEVMNLAADPAVTGSYVGENVTNWKLALTALDATSAHWIAGDFGAFKGGLDLTGLNFSGWQKWIGNRPKESASPNLLFNGNFNVRQLGDTFTGASTPANNNDTYLYDGMILLSDGNDIVDVTFNTADAPADCMGVMQMEVETANKKFGAVFPLEQRDCAGAIGEQVCASIRLRAGSSNVTLDNFKMAIISWAGTADAITSNVVSAWNAADSAPTLAAGWAYESSVANNSVLQTLTTTFTTYCVTGAIDTASAKQFALFVWCDDTDATVNDTILFADAMLQPGWMTTAYPVGDFQTQLARCRRLLRRSNYYVPATTPQNLGVIDMRVAPTVTGAGAGADFTGTTADTLIGFQTAGAVQTLTLDANL